MSWHRDGSHCDNPTSCMNYREIADRRQRATEAWFDAAAGPDPNRNCFTAAVETATQVKITGDITAAALEALDGWDPASSIEAVIGAAFRAAGFEVVE